MDTKVVVGILLGVLVFAGVVWGILDFRKFEAARQRVLSSDIRGEGTIVSVADGAARKNRNQREVVLTLDVAVPHRPVQRVQTSVFAGQMKSQELVPGAKLPVLVDPQDPARVFVDPQATGLSVP